MRGPTAPCCPASALRTMENALLGDSMIEKLRAEGTAAEKEKLDAMGTCLFSFAVIFNSRFSLLFLNLFAVLQPFPMPHSPVAQRRCKNRLSP